MFSINSVSNPPSESFKKTNVAMVNYQDILLYVYYVCKEISESE